MRDKWKSWYNLKMVNIITAKTLIINKGPPGDVVRTTALHNAIDGEIYWFTSKRCAELLRSPRVSRVFHNDNKGHLRLLRKQHFTRVLSLNDEPEMLPLLDGINCDRWEGVYYDVGQPRYTEAARPWFDMSLISRHGKVEADRLKLANRRHVQEHYFKMLGFDWKGEGYDIGIAPKDGVKGRIGLISTATGRWQNKAWAGYGALADRLVKDGYEVVDLGMRPTITDHIADINNCEAIVCGDTLGMHLALALRKKVVALFNCTSPHEIYGYGRMEKVVSPLYEKYFYKTGYSAEATSAIDVGDVYAAVHRILHGKTTTADEVASEAQESLRTVGKENTERR